MSTYERMRIGRYQSWLEDGVLKLYSHEVGKASGFLSSLDAEETLGLLQLLSRHREDIYEAVNHKEREQYSWE